METTPGDHVTPELSYGGRRGSADTIPAMVVAATLNTMSRAPRSSSEENAERLRRFRERIVSGRPPAAGEMHTCLEAVAAVSAAKGIRFSPTVLAIAGRIHHREVAAAHAWADEQAQAS